MVRSGRPLLRAPFTERCRVADGRDSSRQGERTSNKLTAKRAASERVASARAAEAKAVRRRNVLGAGAAVLVVLLLIGGIVFYGLTHKKKTAAANPAVPASSAVTSAVSNVAASSLATTPDFSAVAPPGSLSGAPLTANGKPSVLYVGAEWCPNCGATRWPLAIALSRFGTFTNLQTTYSAESHIPTLSFHGSNYTSQYIDFNGKESVDQQNHPLDKLTPAESQLFTTIGTSGYPFIDFGGKWKQNGTAFDPAILSGLTPESVATTMADASSKPGAAIQGSADLFTAMICGIDGGKPANVCTSAGAIAATTALSAIK